MKSDTTTILCTRAEAIKLINRRNGQRISFGAHVDLPVIGKYVVGEGGSVFPSYGTVTIDRKQAVRLVGSLLANFEERGGRIRLTQYVYYNEHRPNSISLVIG